MRRASILEVKGIKKEAKSVGYPPHVGCEDMAL
jgi:hypothetical protein